jgi:N-acylglucosamine 2-epimerase
MFSKLYNVLEKRPEWLAVAKHGADFLRKHGRDKEGNWYFVLTREGKPLTQPCSIFSDCFAAMAFSQYAQAAGDQEASEIAVATYRNIWRRRENPSGQWDTAVPGTRPIKAYVLPMILINLAFEMEGVISSEQVKRDTEACADEVMNLFLDSKHNLVFENVAPDGSHPDTHEGRLINPGHGIEGMWFVMEVARRRNDQALMKRAVDATLRILAYAWDEVYGGIFTFKDFLGKPLDFSEWDQKLWWVHVETLVALLMGYASTGRPECWEWFKRVHDYTWKVFPDPPFGEWFGDLNRRGEVVLSLKGGKWKGCFHIPRALHRCYLEFHRLAETA